MPALWAGKRANPRKTKKFCLRGRKIWIFFFNYYFFFIKKPCLLAFEVISCWIYGQSSTQRVWVWILLVNKSLYSTDGPSFHFKFRSKFPAVFQGCAFRVMANELKKEGVVCKALGSEILCWGYFCHLEIHLFIPPYQTKNLQRSRKCTEKGILCSYLGLYFFFF